MAVYGVCVVLVLSFILFEVLDVDGSDFTSPLRTATTLKVADPAPEIRRAPLQIALPSHAVTAVTDARAEKLYVQQRIDDASAATPSQASRRHDSRTTLARGLLPDHAPSA
jgi:hypothetical protein